MNPFPRLNVIAILMTCITALPLTSNATTYYVDSKNGNDQNNGTEISNSWKSIEKVNSQKFKPGDKICFSRNSEWIGQLVINSSGIRSNPVIFTAYGTGANPIIKNPGVKGAIAIKIDADWIEVENFFISDSYQAGIYINKGADHNVVRNNEITRSGMGISIHGKYNLVSENYAHDLTMVVNNPGGDNDYGAVGIWLFSSNNEVCYNRLINCKAPSMDYGFDGGVVEFYGDVDSCYVHHNLGENCEGAFEIGGRGDTLSHNRVSYNVYINNGFAGGFHVGGKFGVYFEDMRVENNIFIDTGSKDYAIGFWNGTPKKTDFTYRNNIFYFPNYQRISNQSEFAHEYNIYFLGGKTDIGITLESSEKICDPMFVDLSKNDFRLKPGSPAIDAGLNLNYRFDFIGNSVPFGNAPDIGAFEYIGTSDTQK